MSLKDELSDIRKDLVPWVRQYEFINTKQKPEEPPNQTLERLTALVNEHPDYEPALRELLMLQLLLGNRAKGIVLLRRIINLPGNKNPKVVAKDKAQLKNLLKNPDEELDGFLSSIELNREQFLDLGKYVDEKSDENEEISLKGFPLTEDWVTKVSNASDEDWQKLRARFFEAGIFCDFDLREVYFEMTPEE